MTAVEDDEDSGLLFADVLDRVAEALRDVADIALPQRLFAPASARAEQGHVEFAAQDVLPLGGVGMPVQFAKSARFHFEHDACHGRRNRKLRAIDAPLHAAAEGLERLLRKQTVLVRERRKFPSL